MFTLTKSKSKNELFAKKAGFKSLEDRTFMMQVFGRYNSIIYDYCMSDHSNSFFIVDGFKINLGYSYEYTNNYELKINDTKVIFPIYDYRTFIFDSTDNVFKFGYDNEIRAFYDGKVIGSTDEYWGAPIPVGNGRTFRLEGFSVWQKH